MSTDYKRDIVEVAQHVMNENKDLANKNLLSNMANEIVGLRAEVQRLEASLAIMTKLSTDSPLIPARKISIVLNSDGTFGKCDWIYL